MRVLSRYLVARFLALFAAMLIAAVLSVMIVEMLLNFDDVLKVQDRHGGPLEYFRLLILTQYLRQLVPAAAFSAAFLTLALAAHWLEMMAAKAGGISLQRASLPVVFAALMLALASSAVNETWVLQASRDWTLRSGDTVLALDEQRGAFWYHRGHTIYNLSGADPASRTLTDVRVFERGDDGRLLRSIRAAKVQAEGEHRWRFDRATIRSFESLDAAPRIRKNASLVLEILDDSDAALLGADAALLSLSKLHAYIRTHARSGYATDRLSTALHTRLSSPLVLVALVLLAIPLGIRAEDRRGLGRPALAATTTLAALLLARNIATTLGEQGVPGASVAPWAVAVGFTGWGVWRYLRMPS